MSLSAIRDKDTKRCFTQLGPALARNYWTKAKVSGCDKHCKARHKWCILQAKKFYDIFCWRWTKFINATLAKKNQKNL